MLVTTLNTTISLRLLVRDDNDCRKWRQNSIRRFSVTHLVRGHMPVVFSDERGVDGFPGARRSP